MCHLGTSHPLLVIPTSGGSVFCLCILIVLILCSFQNWLLSHYLLYYYVRSVKVETTSQSFLKLYSNTTKLSRQQVLSSVRWTGKMLLFLFTHAALKDRKTLTQGKAKDFHLHKFTLTPIYKLSPLIFKNSYFWKEVSLFIQLSYTRFTWTLRHPQSQFTTHTLLLWIQSIQLERKMKSLRLLVNMYLLLLHAELCLLNAIMLIFTFLLVM